MLKRLKFKFKIFAVFSILLLTLATNVSGSQLEVSVYLDKAKLVSQQIDLLKDRSVQANNELVRMQHQQEAFLASLSVDRVSKQLYNQAGLEASVAKSNLDSIEIELAEAQQTISRLEKDVQEIENQLNVFNVFGMKIARNSVANVTELKDDLHYQQNLLALEKTRANYLVELQKTADSVLQIFKAKRSRISALLKSQTVMQLKVQQAKSEIAFQEKQSYWLQQLNNLYAQLGKIDNAKKKDSVEYSRLENNIFFANENVNFTYLQMLIARYQDQIHQLKVSISRSSSITLLNKMGDQTQVLTKQVSRVEDLLNNRIKILDKRKAFLTQASQNNLDYVTELSVLEGQYKESLANVGDLNKRLLAFRAALDQALKQELSSRQGLPGFGAKAWWDLGAELLLVPSLTYQVLKNLATNILDAVKTMDYIWWLLFFGLEAFWIGVIYLSKNYLARAVSGMPDHEGGHVNIKWLGIKLLHRTLIDIAVIGNLLGVFYFCGVPPQTFALFSKLSMAWIFFKAIITVARLYLVESLHDSAGHDVRLFHRLQWSLVVSAVVTALTIFIHQLPVNYEVKDLFDRSFLLCLLIMSGFLLRSWSVLPGLILPYIDDKHTYLKTIIRMVGFLIPLILLVNSAIGLCGFVNFVSTISWYESIFVIVLIGYLSLRGVLNEIMDFASGLLIRHVSNGWLWTEAFLKPLDTVMRIILFLCAWATLFLLYGWDQQSPVVERLNKLLQHRLIDVLNTTITPLSILEVMILVAVLYWAAKWTREFVYRLLLSRTRDMGIRNSIAILSQYTMIVIGIIICLRVLGIDFKALAVVAGMFAFGVGIGLRDIANNFVCGFILLIERPLRVGDTVTINGYEGDVIHIGGRAVTVRTWDHMEVLVPNAEIFSKTFVNWTARDNIVRTVIDITINRHDRPIEVQQLIHDVLKNQKDILKDPAPEVFMKKLSEGMTEFEVRYFINLRQVKSRLGVKSDLLVAIWEMFEKNDIQPPYPHHEVFIKNENSNGVKSLVASKHHNSERLLGGNDAIDAEVVTR